MNAETLNVVMIILVILVGGYALYLRHQRGEQVTGATIVGELKAAQPLAQELMTVATIAVNSAEQLKNTGKINSNDAAFDYALNFVKKWIPAAAGVDNADIKAAIESAVLVANFMSDQMGKRGMGNTLPPPAQPYIERH